MLITVCLPMKQPGSAGFFHGVSPEDAADAGGLCQVIGRVKPYPLTITTLPLTLREPMWL